MLVRYGDAFAAVPVPRTDMHVSTTTTTEKRKGYTLMKISNVYTVLGNQTDKDSDRSKSAARRKSSWLGIGAIKKKEVSLPEIHEPASSHSRASTLLHTADIGQALREAIPEVEVSKKRRSMPHMTMKKTLLSIRYVQAPRFSSS